MMLHGVSCSRLVRPILESEIFKIYSYEYVVLNGSCDGNRCPSEPAFIWTITVSFANGSQWNLGNEEMTAYAQGMPNCIKLI